MTDHRHSDIVQLAAFLIGEEEYVVDILRVREIIRPLRITPVRRGPKFIEGVISLRGIVIPVVDMRRRFSLPPADMPHRKIVILSIDARTVGLIVDRVTEVVRVPKGSIQPAPGILEGERAPFFMGVCAYQSRQLILLNVKNVIASDEVVTPESPDSILEPSGLL